MPTGTRDRTARARIREFLAQHGPVQDSSGRATALLKDAVGYQGSAVAFIQLVTAMDKANEIVRDIKGKRTYRVGAPATNAPASFTGAGFTARATRPADGAAQVDHDELARALLREVWKILRVGDEVQGESVLLEAARRENTRLAAERDDYAKRLEIARHQLFALVTDPSLGSGGTGATRDLAAGDAARDLLARLIERPGSAAEQAL